MRSMGAWAESLDPGAASGVCQIPDTSPSSSSSLNKEEESRTKRIADTLAFGNIQIRFLGDPAGAFTGKLDLLFDSAAVFGQDRSKRYAIVTENGKVKSVHLEPDNTGVNGMFPALSSSPDEASFKGEGAESDYVLAESAAEKVLA